MKLLNRIAVLISASLIFMSAFSVFGQNAASNPPAWPYSEFKIILSEKNNITDTNDGAFQSKLNQLASSTVSAFFALTRDHPDLTMWVSGYGYRTAWSYYTVGNNTTYTLNEIQYTLNGYPNYTDPAGMLNQLSAVVDDFRPSGDTVYDKLVSIHDYICRMNTYVREDEGAKYCYSAYGSLVNRKSVCEGYAEAFKLLCDKAGIDCVLVSGMSDNGSGVPEGHMWNYVKMDNGAWYAVDVTWDDAGNIPNSYGYFLVGSSTKVNGKLFSESHKASNNLQDIEQTGSTIQNFKYPDLSKNAYQKEVTNGSYNYGVGVKYHYGFLNDLERELYDAMLAHLKASTPTDPSKTPPPASTDDMVTAKPETTIPETTNPSTTAPNTAKPDTTNPSTTAPDTTKPDTTKPNTTVPDTTKPETTKPNTTVPDTTKSDTTKPETTAPITTEDTLTTETTARPDTTVPSTTAKDTEAPETKPITSQTQTDTTVSDTLVTDSTSSTETEPPVSQTTSDVTESDSTGLTTDTEAATGGEQGSSSDDNAPQTITVAVIVCAVASLSGVIVTVVIRYTKKHH